MSNSNTTSSRRPARRRSRSRKPKAPASLGKLEIIPLGGMGEIGKNITAFRFEDEILVVDGGLAFPEENMPGVDILIPRIDYLVENAKLIKGWVLTHGHEDHIGGLPFLLPQLPKIPLYGAKLTLGLLRGKLEEFGLKPGEFDLNPVSPDETLRIGRHFTVDMFRMTHSIPDNSGLIIRTPVGNVVHTGDFKLDPTPVDRKVSHLAKVAQAGAEGVLLLIADSTNAERPGITPSEAEVAVALDAAIGAATGRVFVTTFASHIHRVQSVIRAAERHGRKVAMDGRSMLKFAKIALELGYLEVKDRLYTTEEIKDVPDREVLVLATGSQGQPMAVLSRLAFGRHAKLSVGEGDTVILSSSPIPGNEEAVNRVINKLYDLGASVLYPPAYKVHASGHASREELRFLYNLVQPKFFVPWHGEIRHQTNFKWLAEAMPKPPVKTIIPENGDVLELTAGDLKKTGKVKAGALYVDGLGVGDITDDILEERQDMAADGIVIITALVSENPVVEVVSRGFVKAGQRLHAEIRRVAREAVLKGVREKKPLEQIRDDVYYPAKKFIRKATGRDPILIPILFEA